MNVTIFGLSNFTSVTLQIYTYNSTSPSYYQQITPYNQTLSFTAGRVDVTNLDTSSFWIDPDQGYQYYDVAANVSSLSRHDYFTLNRFSVIIQLNQTYSYTMGEKVTVTVSTKLAQAGANLNLTVERSISTYPYPKVFSQNRTLDAAGKNITSIDTAGFTSGWYQIVATVYSQGVQATGYSSFRLLAFNVTLELNQAVAGGYATPKLTIKTSSAQTNANISISVFLYGLGYVGSMVFDFYGVDATNFAYYLPLAGQLPNGTESISVTVKSSAGSESDYAYISYKALTDTDGDGLPDAAEEAIGTDPQKVDSGTGYPDGLAWFEGVVRAPVLIRVNPTTNVLVMGFIAVNGTGFGDGESIAIYLAGRIIKNATATAQGLLREVLIEIPNGTLTGTYTVYVVGRTTGLTSNSVQIAVVGKSISFEQVAPQIVNITVAGAPVQLSVKTNATLANLVYNETVKKMTFEIAGPTGTKGVANLAPPISLFPTGDVRVLVDGSPASDAQITKNSTHLNIRLTVTFASVKTITIEQVAAAAVLDLTTILAVVVGVVVVVAMVGVVLMKRRKKSLEAPPATPSTPQPGVKFEALN